MRSFILAAACLAILLAPVVSNAVVLALVCPARQSFDPHVQERCDDNYSTTQITSDPDFQQWPSVSGNKVAYADFLTSAIHVYDNETKTDTIIGYGSTRRPIMHENKVVWVELGRVDAVGFSVYDLSTRVGYVIPIEGDVLYDSRFVRDFDFDGTNLVYTKQLNNNVDIYLYNLETRQETRLTDDPFPDKHPRVFGNFIIYVNNPDLNDEGLLRLYNIDARSTQDVLVNGLHIRGSYPDHNLVRWPPETNGWLVGHGWITWSTASEVMAYTPETKTHRAQYVGDRAIPVLSGDEIAWVQGGLERPLVVYNARLDIKQGIPEAQPFLPRSSESKELVHGHPSIGAGVIAWVGIHKETGFVDVYLTAANSIVGYVGTPPLAPCSPWPSCNN